MVQLGKLVQPWLKRMTNK